MGKPDEKVEISATSSPELSAKEPEPLAKEPTSKPPGAGPGRPKKGEERPVKEPLPKARKPAEDIKDPRGGIDRCVENLSTLMASYAELHPESDLQWVWRKLRETLPEEKGRIGAPVADSAFAPPIRGIMRGVELVGGLRPEEQATAEEINDVARDWARASTHLGMSERFAAVASAVSKTAGLAARQVTRTVISLLGAPGEESAIERPLDAPQEPEGEDKSDDEA